MGRKLLAFALLAVIVSAFYGCPVGLEHPMGTPGTEAIDPALIGTWTIKEGQDREALKFRIAQKDANSYTVEVLEEGYQYALDTNLLTGWVTRFNGETFFYLKAENEDGYYHYHYELTGKNSLIMHDVLLFDGRRFAVSSTETMRREVATAMKNKDWGINKTEYLRYWKDGKP